MASMFSSVCSSHTMVMTTPGMKKRAPTNASSNSRRMENVWRRVTRRERCDRWRRMLAWTAGLMAAATTGPESWLSGEGNEKLNQRRQLDHLKSWHFYPFSFLFFLFFLFCAGCVVSPKSGTHHAVLCRESLWHIPVCWSYKMFFDCSAVKSSFVMLMCKLIECSDLEHPIRQTSVLLHLDDIG